MSRAAPGAQPVAPAARVTGVDPVQAFDWQPGGEPPIRSLAEQLAQRIARDIYTGHHAPGQWIREQGLSQHYQVSRGPVREALRLLERDGLVHILPRRGARVTDLSADELGNIFEVRAHLLALAVQRLAQRADQRVITLAGGGVRALAAIVAADDGRSQHADAYVDVSARLTLLTAEYCGNPQLADFLRSLSRQTRRYTRLGLASAALRRASLRGWRRVLRHLRRGEAQAAGEAMRELVLRSCDEARRRLAAGEQPGSGYPSQRSSGAVRPRGEQ